MISTRSVFEPSCLSDHRFSPLSNSSIFVPPPGWYVFPSEGYIPYRPQKNILFVGTYLSIVFACTYLYGDTECLAQVHNTIRVNATH